MPLTFRPKATDLPPIEAESLRAGLSADEARRLPVWVGNRAEEAGDLFEIEGGTADDHLILEGDFRRVRGLGRGWNAGRLTIRGDAGEHVGAGMSGGEVVVEGSVGDWAGAEMRGGILRIAGSAGDSLGAAHPGSRRGMREGVILVGGRAGHDVGLGLRRGLIALTGGAGEGCGRSMIAGSIVSFGPIARRAGAGMKRGSLILFGERPTLLPTFSPSGRYRPPFVTILLKWLVELGLPVPPRAFSGEFERSNGDLVEGGQGEVLHWAGSDRVEGDRHVEAQ